MTSTSASARPGALSLEEMQRRTAAFPDYRANKSAPAIRHADIVQRLFGGRLTPLMAAPATRGRFAEAPVTCPPTACTGKLDLAAGAVSQPWRNPEAIECIVCVEGDLEIRYGPELDKHIKLGRFDMVSIPANVRLQVANVGNDVARSVNVLSVTPTESYDAVFDTSQKAGVSDQISAALGLRFDDDTGVDIDAATVEGRVTRFERLVPYKKDLKRTGGLPPEATEKLTAGNVYPLIVPEGHVGRSRTAPMYGKQGLYIAIAECRGSEDGPPPHAHSDTQESFYALDGSFDICTGFENESVIRLKPHDLIGVPNKVMRTFVNTTGKPAHLLVIIQGPERMTDTVSYSRQVGQQLIDQFGPEIVDAFAQVHMTFDAEDRLKA